MEDEGSGVKCARLDVAREGERDNLEDALHGEARSQAQVDCFQRRLQLWVHVRTLHRQRVGAVALNQADILN